MKPVVYFRGAWNEEEEFQAASRHFHTVRYRTEIPQESLVIPRYSLLPFPEELDHDVKNLKSVLINTTEQHRFVADVRQYWRLLEGVTPKTWDTWYNLPEGSYVVKGITNSRKSEWSTRMFASTRKDVGRVANSLLDDDLIKSQGLVVREYIPLVTYMEGLNGIPIANEWRFFILDRQILTAGYYWATEPDCCPTSPMAPPEGAVQMAQEAILRVGGQIRFFVVDVAEKAAGGWMVVELNDGQQSGLSLIDPDVFYQKLAEALPEK